MRCSALLLRPACHRVYGPGRLGRQKGFPSQNGIEPALFSSFWDDHYSLGVKFSVGYTGTRKIDWLDQNSTGGDADIAQRLRYLFKARMKGSLAVEPEANPDPLYLEAQWGVRYSYVELVDFRKENVDEPLSYYFAGSLMGRLESDQMQDNRLASLGAHLNAVTDNNSVSGA